MCWNNNFCFFWDGKLNDYFVEDVIVTMGTPDNATASGIIVHTATIIPDADANISPPTVTIDPVTDTAALIVPIIYTLHDPDAAENLNLTVEYNTGAWTTASSAGGDDGIINLGNGTFLFNWAADSDIGSGPAQAVQKEEWTLFNH